MLKNLMIAALCVFALSSQSLAETVNEREHNQGHRIYSGISQGSMTRREAARATADLARIQARETRFRQSGAGYSARERAITQHALNHNSRQIYRLKHNGR
ncbi:MAG: hypothetical protein AB1758_06100 [Candidatus Eremiobacterota bacterium]